MPKKGQTHDTVGICFRSIPKITLKNSLKMICRAISDTPPGEDPDKQIPMPLPVPGQETKAAVAVGLPATSVQSPFLPPRPL